MDYVITALGLALLAATAYWLGLRAQKREAAQPPPHRAVVVGVEGFCRLIRGWEWVAPDEGGGTVGVTLRGIGGTTGMQLALVQVEREIAAGTRHPIAGDTVGLMLSINGRPFEQMRPILDDPEGAAREGIRLGDQA